MLLRCIFRTQFSHCRTTSSPLRVPCPPRMP